MIMMLLNSDKTSVFRDVYLRHSGVNILMFLLSPTVSTLNPFRDAAYWTDDGIERSYATLRFN